MEENPQTFEIFKFRAMQDDSRGYLVDLENLEIRIGGDCPDFLTAKKMLVEYAKKRLVEAGIAVRITRQNFLNTKSNFFLGAVSGLTNGAKLLGARARHIEADCDLSGAERNLRFAHQDFIRAQQTKNPYEFQPYENMGFDAHGPLTALNLNGEG